jgi:hypothetical protein
VLTYELSSFDSMLTQFADPRNAPEMLTLREQIRSWRFYDHFRTDIDAPARLPQIGTHTPVLSDDGADMAAALQTILEIGDSEALAEAVADAFPRSSIEVLNLEGRFEIAMHQHGLLRPLRAAELSDGTLRYLLWIAALLTPRPPELLVLDPIGSFDCEHCRTLTGICHNTFAKVGRCTRRTRRLQFREIGKGVWRDEDRRCRRTRSARLALGIALESIVGAALRGRPFTNGLFRTTGGHGGPPLQKTPVRTNVRRLLLPLLTGVLLALHAASAVRQPLVLKDCVVQGVQGKAKSVWTRRYGLHREHHQQIRWEWDH